MHEFVLRKPSPALPKKMPKAPAKKDLAAAATAVSPDTSYEAALQELEQWLARMEAGQLPLDEMLSGYQRAGALLNFCRSRLDAVQAQIQVLDDGVLQPWKEQD